MGRMKRLARKVREKMEAAGRTIERAAVKVKEKIDASTAVDGRGVNAEALAELGFVLEERELEEDEVPLLEH
ncbi:MAG: hypothetical protein M1830_002469 [Pleopsidium flavum]|nr:MAG: hypothetical protein M1830_002469 [Pleopsidium flavum]